MSFAEDFDALFKGNTDEHFRIGISISKKSLKLYSPFYMADIIIASPLGLRTVIGAQGYAVFILLLNFVSFFAEICSFIESTLQYF